MTYRLLFFLDRLQHAIKIGKLAYKLYLFSEVEGMIEYYAKVEKYPIAQHMLDQWNLISTSASMSSKREYHKITQTFYGDF